jgi:hypothetical protein
MQTLTRPTAVDIAAQVRAGRRRATIRGSKVVVRRDRDRTGLRDGDPRDRTGQWPTR